VNLEGALTWAFEFEGQPYFAGFRSLTSNGIDKPVLNVFRMFSRMTGQRLAATSDGAIPVEEIIRSGVRTRPDVGVLAGLDQKKLCVMVWHYHDDDEIGPEAAVELVFDGLPLPNGYMQLQHFRIDENHSNAFAAWKRMGSPQMPSPEQYSQMESAGQLAAMGEVKTVQTKDGHATLNFPLPRQAVSLLQFTW
jgi:xylan 1,4-beta-xylosidase